MIPPYLVEQIHDILSEQNQASLENIFKVFQKKFVQDNYNLFNPCFLLVQALYDNVLTKPQRLLAIFLISEAFKNEKSNPFTLNLLDICERAQDHYEKKLIFDVVVKGSRDSYGYMSMKTIQEEQEKFTEEFKHEDEVDQMKRSLQDQYHRIPTTATTQIRNIVPDSIYIDKKNEAPHQIPPNEKLWIMEKEFLGFQPDFLRPLPTPLPMKAEDDFYWLELGIFPDIQWDFNISLNQNILSQVKELMQKAFQTPLTIEETKLLQEIFNKNEKLLQNCGLTPQLLPDLVEKNATLASFLLAKLHGQPNITEYFEKLCQIDVTLQTLEVFNKLANTVVLPKEYLNYFITNCIQQCANQKDKSHLTRIVRLVCVFIKAMIKQKNINPKELFIELQAFCIEYSKISEANVLFKMLKQFENDKQGQQQQ